MVLTITLNELAFDVGRSDDPLSLPPARYVRELTNLLAVADTMITSYADAAPDAMKNQAAIMLIGHLLEMPRYTNNVNVSTPASVFRNSLARALLSEWHLPATATV